MTNGRIVLKDLAELGRFADVVVRQESDVPRPTPPTPPVSVEPPDSAEVEALMAALEEAARQLRALAEIDARARAQAASAVATYRQLEETARGLEQLAVDADATAAQAHQFAASALGDDCRKQAEQVKAVAMSLATTAHDRLATARAQAAELLERSDVRRVLEEEQRAAEAAARAAEEHRRQEALRRGIERVEVLITEGNENEARRLLGVLGKDHPNSPEPASYIATLDRRAGAVKCDAAERALRRARPLGRRAPSEAIALLAELDLDGVPDPLVRQVYGCWLAACRRLHLTGACLYSPRFGQGALLAPADDGRLAVVSAVGLPEWTAGRRFAAAALRGARSL